MSTVEQIAAWHRLIIAYNKKTGVLDEQIAALDGKVDRYRNRRAKKGQQRQTLRRKRQNAADAILLTLVKADPAERQSLLDQQGERLTTLLPSSLHQLLQHQDAPASPAATADANRQSPANGLDDDAAGTPDDSAQADLPDSATDAAADKPQSPTANVVGDAPSEQKTRPDKANDPAPVNPNDRPTAKQIQYIEVLIEKFPDQAQKIGIDAKSLRTMTKRTGELGNKAARTAVRPGTRRPRQSGAPADQRALRTLPAVHRTPRRSSPIASGPERFDTNRPDIHAGSALPSTGCGDRRCHP